MPNIISHLISTERVGIDCQGGLGKKVSVGGRICGLLEVHASAIGWCAVHAGRSGCLQIHIKREVHLLKHEIKIAVCRQTGTQEQHNVRVPYYPARNLQCARRGSGGDVLL